MHIQFCIRIVISLNTNIIIFIATLIRLNLQIFLMLKAKIFNVDQGGAHIPLTLFHSPPFNHCLHIPILIVCAITVLSHNSTISHRATLLTMKCSFSFLKYCFYKIPSLSQCVHITYNQHAMYC